MLSQPKNYLIKDVELNWARLDTPTDNPFGGDPSWELQVATTDKTLADDMKANDLNVKEKDGKFVVSLRRKSVTKDGNPMEPVRVVDASKAPMDGPARRKIGNGSTGNVIVWLAPYDFRGRTGVTASLTAVQVTDLVEYSGGGADIDFDVVSGGEETPADLF